MGGSVRPARLKAQEVLRLALLLAAAFLCSGCFLFYDSRWGQEQESQKRVAAKRMPNQLRSEAEVTVPGEPTRTPATRLKIRAYATPHYEGALVDGKAQFEQAISDANPTFAHDLSLRLELTGYRVWSNAMADDDLAQLIEQIRKEDAASDVDWVVVLASPRQMVATSADQLGVGLMLGRHLAIRAMSDAAEFDWIEKRFTELSEDEKRRLYAARKRHKAAAVLLHEIGHTLGMPHELDSRSMMSATYNTDANAFGAHAARLGQRALELRATSPGTELSRRAAQAALNVLSSAPAHTWEASSAREVEGLLQQYLKAGQTAAVGKRRTEKPAVTPRAASAAGQHLPEVDRALLSRARDADAAGDVAQARSIAAPLFQSYPDDFAVQELRCQLAMKAGLPMDVERAECEPLVRLSRLPTPK